MENLFTQNEEEVKNEVKQSQENQNECKREKGQESFFLSPTDTLPEDEIEDGEVEEDADEELFRDLLGNVIEDESTKKLKAKREQEEKAKQAKMKLEQSKADRAKKAEEKWTKVIPLGTTVAYAGFYQVLTEDTTLEDIRVMILKAGHPEMGAKSDVVFKFHEDLRLLNATIGGGKAGGDPIPSDHVFTNLKDLIKSLKPLEQLPGMKHPNVSTPVRYVYGMDGIYAVQKNKIGIFTAWIESYPEGFYDHQFLVKEAFQMSLPKIPQTLLKQVEGLFRHYAEQNAEVTALIWWNTRKREYEVSVPLQEVSGVYSDWQHDEAWYDHHVLVMDIHSHHNLPGGAYFSKVDDRKDKQTKFYAVMGRVSSPYPELKISYVCAGKRIELPAFLWSSLFEIEQPSFPEEWTTQVVVSERSV